MQLLSYCRAFGEWLLQGFMVFKQLLWLNVCKLPDSFLNSRFVGDVGSCGRSRRQAPSS